MNKHVRRVTARHGPKIGSRTKLEAAPGIDVGKAYAERAGRVQLRPSDLKDRVVHGRQRQAASLLGREDAEEAFVSTLLDSIAACERHETPYRHWFMQRCLPATALDQILALPFLAPD